MLGKKLKLWPLTLQIEPTSLCNFSCVYCTQHAGKKHRFLCKEEAPSGNMSLESFRKILDKYPSAYLLQLQGQGEPLINKEFEAMVREARSRGIIVFTITNGAMLSSRLRRLSLLQSGIDAIFISMDIAEKAEMESTRIGMRYQSVIDNFIALRNERNETGAATLLGISAVVFSRNVGILQKKLVEYDKLLKPDIIGVSELASADATLLDYRTLYNSEILRETINKPFNINQDSLQALVKKVGEWNFRQGVCCQTNSVYIRYDGSTAYCAIRHKVNAVDSEQTMKEAAKLMKSGKIPSGCSGCHYLPKSMKRGQA
jgi:molybdenum cofactor biosynthesis enzyme MoaA